MSAFTRSCFVFLVFFTFAASAQEQAILRGASQIYDANYNMDFEPIAELTYPKVIEQMGGKENFTANLDVDFQNSEFRKRLQLTSPVFKVGPIKTIDSRKFCVISYRNPTRYFYENKLDADAMKKQVSRWKQLSGTKDVFGEPNRNSVNVKRVSKLIAVSDASTDGQWKFFNFDDVRQVEIFNSIFASEKAQLGL